MGVVVECHSGYTFPDRPKAIYKDNERLEVETIETEWRSPEGKFFRVKTMNGSIFELFYDEASDNWQIRQI
jgi:hypothetical protein